jgi:hypothetical protein
MRGQKRHRRISTCMLARTRPSALRSQSAPPWAATPEVLAGRGCVSHSTRCLCHASYSPVITNTMHSKWTVTMASASIRQNMSVSSLTARCRPSLGADCRHGPGSTDNPPWVRPASAAAASGRVCPTGTRRVHTYDRGPGVAATWTGSSQSAAITATTHLLVSRTRVRGSCSRRRRI